MECKVLHKICHHYEDIHVCLYTYIYIYIIFSKSWSTVSEQSQCAVTLLSSQRFASSREGLRGRSPGACRSSVSERPQELVGGEGTLAAFQAAGSCFSIS